YLGKKIQAGEVKLVVLYILFVPLVVLGFAGASAVLGTAKHAVLNPGAHGFSEIVYAFTSAGNNNGSAFAGLSVTSNWYQTTLGSSMLVGRFLLIVPVLAIAGSLVRKQTVPASAGTFPTGTPLFAGLLTGATLIVVELGSVLVTILFLRDAGSSSAQQNVFAGLVAAFLWFTVLFANFAEAVAEGRGKAQADTLRRARTETPARRRRPDGTIEQVPS